MQIICYCFLPCVVLTWNIMKLDFVVSVSQILHLLPTYFIQSVSIFKSPIDNCQLFDWSKHWHSLLLPLFFNVWILDYRIWNFCTSILFCSKFSPRCAACQKLILPENVSIEPHAKSDPIHVMELCIFLLYFLCNLVDLVTTCFVNTKRNFSIPPCFFEWVFVWQL